MVKEQIFLDYIKLRYQAKLTPGQSGDEIIDNFYFCNIKREWDKVSRYIIENIIEAEYFKGTEFIMSDYDKLRNIFLARMHNKIETLEQLNIPSMSYNIKDEEILKKQNPHSYRTQKLLERLKQQTKGWDDSFWCVANHLEEILPDSLLGDDELDLDWSNFKDSISSWAKVTGLQEESFIVYQLALDTEWLVNNIAKELGAIPEYEIDNYYILGPGAIRGINMIYFLEEKVKSILDDKNLLALNGLIPKVFEDDKLNVLELTSEYNFTKKDFSNKIKGADYDEAINKLQKFVNESQWAKDNDIYIIVFFLL